LSHEVGKTIKPSEGTAATFVFRYTLVITVPSEHCTVAKVSIYRFERVVGHID